MRILAIEREPPTPARPNLHDLLRDEAAGVWDMWKHEFIRNIWFTANRCAVIMLECANATEARRHLAALPLVQHGLIEFTVLELRSYDGFERLFGRSAAIPAVPAKPEEPPEY